MKKRLGRIILFGLISSLLLAGVSCQSEPEVPADVALQGNWSSGERQEYGNVKSVTTAAISSSQFAMTIDYTIGPKAEENFVAGAFNSFKEFKLHRQDVHLYATYALDSVSGGLHNITLSNVSVDSKNPDMVAGAAGLEGQQLLLDTTIDGQLVLTMPETQEAKDALIIMGNNVSEAFVKKTVLYKVAEEVPVEENSAVEI